MMNPQAKLRIMLLASLMLLCCCAAAQKQSEQESPISKAKGEEVSQKVSTAELKQLYEAAKSQYERRAICLRAIDEGAIRQYGPVSSIDAIFGTHFAQELPTRKESPRTRVIRFAPDSPSPNNTQSSGRIVQIPYVGWYMAVEYDFNGNILNYYLTNLDK